MSIFSQTAKDVLLAQANAANNLPFPVTEKNLYFGQAQDNGDGLGKVATVGMLGDVYTGYADLYFKRINLSGFYDDRPILRSPGALNLYAMLGMVNQYLGLNLTEDDVVNTDVADLAPGEQTNINVVAKPTSLGYTGSFVIRYYRIRQQLSAVVKNTELTVLNHLVDPSNGKRDLDMWMWNVDFSNDVTALKTNAANTTWANFQAVKDLVATQFGFTDWPAPEVDGVSDYATKDYPGSNPNYQRVVVQKNVVGQSYQGNALFHYNLT